MSQEQSLPLFVSIPHSGEKIPDSVTWLKGLSETTLMRDVDRYVDKLYEPALNNLDLSAIIASWHRYVVDLNRKPDQYDASAVVGAPMAQGEEPKGLHWSQTTFGEVLIAEPMSQELHQDLLKNYYQPFHDQVQKMRTEMKKQFGVVYHLDLHSMPSVGTSFHKDPGQERADIVVSDFHGEKSGSEFKELVMKAYQEVGFQVAYNWPYVGGGVTRMYGEPDQGFHTLQIEMNRRIYMNEETKLLIPENVKDIQDRLSLALTKVKTGVEELLHG